MDLFTWIARLLGGLLALGLLVFSIASAAVIGAGVFIVGILLALFAGRGRGPWRMVMRDSSADSRRTTGAGTCSTGGRAGTSAATTARMVSAAVRRTKGFSPESSS
jgi:hypothetical protein